MLISRKEKEKQIIKLAEEGKTTRKIAKAIHISLKDIGKIIRQVIGYDYDPIEKEEEEENMEKTKRRLSHLMILMAYISILRDDCK